MTNALRDLQGFVIVIQNKSGGCWVGGFGQIYATIEAATERAFSEMQSYPDDVLAVASLGMVKSGKLP